MNANSKGMTYAGSGVDYGAMDPFKIACQRRAALTEKNARRLGFNPISSSRGESVFLMEERWSPPCGVAVENVLGHVEEGLGTKNLVADAMYALTGKSYYDQVAQDTVAMIVNDMATGGVLPIGLAMHLAVGESSWFDDEARTADLVNGWGSACDKARCIWSGGETPTLSGIIVPGTALLSGSAFGVVKQGHLPIDQKSIQPGDAIVLIGSSGIHANGLTLARKIAEKLPQGYLTEVPGDGRPYGEVLLDPTHIYVGLIEDCLNAGIDIHYAVNITGHGWRKLMRASKSLRYVIEELLLTDLPIFDFLQEHGPVSDEEAYGNLNMGAGFALYVPESEAQKVVDIAIGFGFTAGEVGYIEQGDVKQVIIEPKGLEYDGSTLGVR